MKTTNNEKIKKIINNYEQLEKELVIQLQFDCDHGTTVGTFREEVWKTLFERIIPKKFAIEHSVFIIDSHGEISNEVDLAIFDEQYTPYIFNYGQIKFIPIEAVAVAVECKSSELKPTILENWSESINKLETSLNSVVRISPHVIGFEHEVKNKDTEELHYKQMLASNHTQTATRPIKILCHTAHSTSEKISNLFDIILHPKDDNKLEVEFSGCDNNLIYWYEQLNHRTGKSEEKVKCKYSIDDYIVKRKNDKITLLSFIFQLNQLLMLINNPLFFPHKDYVDMFNKQLDGGE